mgnify:CR=1 FL=1
MPRPPIIISPYPRTISETFDRETWDRLGEVAHIVWGNDEPMPEELFGDALADATVAAVGEWVYGRDALAHASSSFRAVFELLGTHNHPYLDYETCFARDINVGSIAPEDFEAVISGSPPTRMQYATPELVASLRGSA